MAQSYKDNIKQSFDEFNKLIISGEFDKSMDYVPEAMFKIVPRASLVAVFEQLMTNKEMEFKFLDFKITEIGDSKKIDTSYYVLVKYTGTMTMKFNPEKTETPEAKSNRMSMTKTALANVFGSDNVKLDEATETYTLSPRKNSWAISKNGQTDWKFVNVEPGQRLIMEKILPRELIEAVTY